MRPTGQRRRQRRRQCTDALVLLLLFVHPEFGPIIIIVVVGAVRLARKVAARWPDSLCTSIQIGGAACARANWNASRRASHFRRRRTLQPVHRQTASGALRRAPGAARSEARHGWLAGRLGLAGWLTGWHASTHWGPNLDGRAETGRGGPRARTTKLRGWRRDAPTPAPSTSSGSGSRLHSAPLELHLLRWRASSRNHWLLGCLAGCRGDLETKY